LRVGIEIEGGTSHTHTFTIHTHTHTRAVHGLFLRRTVVRVGVDERLSQRADINGSKLPVHQ
jgi:hypothetical protein